VSTKQILLAHHVELVDFDYGSTCVVELVPKPQAYNSIYLVCNVRSYLTVPPANLNIT
jgi:hypothetical protein